jgi:exosortase
MQIFKKAYFDSMQAVLILIIVLFVPFVFLYHGLMFEHFKWALVSENEWQFLVLPISLFMFWSARYRLQTQKPVPLVWLGIIFYCITAGLYIGGVLFLSESIMELSILFYIFGTSFLFFGFNITKIIMWPLFYLLLATSLFTYLQDFLTPYLQILAASIAVKLLNLFKLTVLQNGTYFRIPGGVLNVADACSGFNQLFVLMALSIPLVYTVLRKIYWQLMIIILAIPISIIVNGIRIMFIGIWNYSSMKADSHGPYDLFYSPFIFLFGLLLLYIVTMFVSRFEKNTQTVDVVKWKITAHRTPFISLTVLLLTAFCAVIFVNRNSTSMIPQLPIKAPTGWSSSTTESALRFDYFNESVKRIQADCKIAMNFSDGTIPVQFEYAVLKKSRPERSAKCIVLPPGCDRFEEIEFTDGEKVHLARRTIVRGDSGTLYWWLSTGEKKTADMSEFKSAFAINALKNGVTSVSFVMFFIPGDVKNGLALVRVLYESIKPQLSL